MFLSVCMKETELLQYCTSQKCKPNKKYIKYTSQGYCQLIYTMLQHSLHTAVVSSLQPLSYPFSTCFYFYLPTTCGSREAVFHMGPNLAKAWSVTLNFILKCGSFDKKSTWLCLYLIESHLEVYILYITGTCQWSMPVCAGGLAQGSCKKGYLQDAPSTGWLQPPLKWYCVHLALQQKLRFLCTPQKKNTGKKTFS